MGLEFYNLSHRFGYQSPNWPYFEDVKIERIQCHAKSGVLSQRSTASMHNTTHIDAPAHVVQGTPFIDEVPLPHFFGSGIVVSIPKKKWEQITYDDLEKAAGKVVRPRDVVIVNTGWHKLYEDNEDYFCRAPGFVPSAGEWFVEKKVKVVGHDTQANDHPLATAIGPQRNGPLHPTLPTNTRSGREGATGRMTFRNGSQSTASCSRTASSASRTSAATSTRSPASAAPSRFSRGTGIVATAASFGSSPSPTPRASTGSRRGRSSDASQTSERSQSLRSPQPSGLLFAAPVRSRRRRPETIHGRPVAFPARRRCGPRRLADRKGLLCALGRTHAHRRRQGDWTQGQRLLLHRAE